MKLIVRSRRGLILTTLAVQALALTAGGVVLHARAHEDMGRAVEAHVLRESVRRAHDVVRELRDAGVRELGYGSPGWREAQRVIEPLASARGGYVAIVDRQGRVLCHPQLRTEPRLRGAVIVPEGPRTDVPSDAPERDGTFLPVGEAVRAQGHFAALAPIPGLDASVYVSQSESEVFGLRGSARDGLIALGGLVGAGVLSLTASAMFFLWRRYDSQMERLNRGLEAEVEHRVAQSLGIRHALIFGLAKLADYRDCETGQHLERICAYSALLARELRATFAEIDDDWIERLTLAASLHDIGKVGIPDAVLLKAGPLTPDERLLMERHPLIGADTLLAIRERIGDDALVDMGIQVALQHHERWDGSGYPYGLSGTAIAPAARIVALADVYDALTSDRVYKRAFSHAEACRVILDGRGRQFDPAVVAAFERVHERFDDARRARLPSLAAGRLPLPGDDAERDAARLAA